VRDQLEALILQMYKSNILYSEAVREFKKRFILTVLQEIMEISAGQHASWMIAHSQPHHLRIEESHAQLAPVVKRPPAALVRVYDKKIFR